VARLLQVNRRAQTEPASYSLKKATQSIGTGAVLDVETTGFSPYKEEIVELAITVFRYDRVNGQVLEVVSEYSGLREPCRRIPRAATAVHGITRSAVKGLELNYRRVREMLREAEFVIGHYAAFDRSFVERLIPSLRKKTWLCSRDGIDWVARGFTSRSLGELATAHDIQNPREHRAASDAATLLELLSYRQVRRRPYLYDLLRNAGIILPKRRRT
jgi:DNA polymerase III subunit epsilon